MTQSDDFPGIGPDERMELYCASLAGVPELAYAMKRVGLSDDEDCLEDARKFLPMLHEAIEAARRGEA